MRYLVGRLASCTICYNELTSYPASGRGGDRELLLILNLTHYYYPW